MFVPPPKAALIPDFEPSLTQDEENRFVSLSPARQLAAAVADLKRLTQDLPYPDHSVIAEIALCNLC